MNQTISWRNYWKPTPKKIRQWADAILVACVSFGNMLPEYGKLLMTVGTIIKLLSNFFKDVEDPSSPDANLGV